MATVKNNKRTLQALRKERDRILDISARHGASNIRVFGSVARGEAGPTSDVDFLVDLEPERSYFDLGGLWTDLEELLGCRVEVLTQDELHWYIRDRILKEAVPL
jgi:predicted nucleotidyltransferase